MPGRPSKLTPEAQTSIVRDLAAGLPRYTACVRAGLTYDTMRTWIRRGRKGGKDNAIYSAFLLAVKKAEQDAIARNVAVIQKAANETWQAAAWWLERKFPEQWAKTERQEVSGPRGKAVQHDVRATITTELEPYKVALQALGRGELGPCGDDIPQDGSQEPVHSAQANGKTSTIPDLPGS